MCSDKASGFCTATLNSNERPASTSGRVRGAMGGNSAAGDSRATPCDFRPPNSIHALVRDEDGGRRGRIKEAKPLEVVGGGGGENARRCRPFE
ncbi:hypothetical protein B0I35DRAFT_168604 [Stachybotrys elegans]|uniref:Uncharacterized protein n=1 Tax=Stachybotrys elegans TaxID=80388 RepID=A0A8K0SYA7_9HYPO|nr:hypothetical protein B0I35DRAFT_168604 [Stachybotrys elegans]